MPTDLRAMRLYRLFCARLAAAFWGAYCQRWQNLPPAPVMLLRIGYPYAIEGARRQ